MGWFVGYDGHFKFDNIGDSYIDNKVPYVAFRAMPALMGSLTVPVVFLTMWESGYSLPACLVATGLVLFGMLFYYLARLGRIVAYGHPHR